jgi:hypothetical protein
MWYMDIVPRIQVVQTLPAADAGFAGIGDVGETWSSTFRDSGQHLIIDFRFGVLRGQQNTYVLPTVCVK